MRVRKRWILLAGLLVWFGSGRYGDWFEATLAWLRGVQQTGYREDATRHTTILLTKKRWTEFQVSPHATTLRVMTNAGLRKLPEIDAPSPHFSLAYQVIDARNRVLHQTTYHFHASVKLDGGSGEATSFFATTPFIPSQTSTMQIPLEPLDGTPARVRLRVIDKDPSIAEVVVRILGRHERVNFDQAYTWRRLSRNRREDLCRTSVYTQDLLTPQERRNLLRWQWTPTPPVGVGGVDYEQRVMYIVKSIVADGSLPDPLPPGVLAKPNLRAIVPIPETQGVARLELESVDKIYEASPATATIRWFGRGIHLRKTWQVLLDQPIQMKELELYGGTIEVESNARIVVRAHFRESNNSKPIDITPTPLKARLFVVDHDPVEFTIQHLGKLPTPFRVDVRRIVDLETRSVSEGHNGQSSLAYASGSQPCSMKWSWLDTAGGEVKQGTMSIDATLSIYDQMLVAEGTDRISNSASFFFSIPHNVVKIRFEAPDEPLLVNGFNRPPKMPKLTKVPTDYHAFKPQAIVRPTWFKLNPDGHETLIQNNRSRPVRIQSRPPEDDPEIVAGNYQWEDFEPNGLWKARHLLLPHEPERHVRDESLAVVFHEFKPNVPHEVQFVGDRARQWVEPRLIYLRPNGSSSDLTVLIGEIDAMNSSAAHKLHLKMRSSRGEIPLPQKAIGSRAKLRIVADKDVRVFVRNVIPAEDSPRFLKRLAHRFDGQHLRFDYEKASDEKELLMLKIFRNERQGGSSRIHVRVDSADRRDMPTRHWTIKHRVFDLQPAASGHAIVLGKDESVDAGQVCYVSLGDDIPRGRCSIELQAEDEFHGYVVLYRTTPGLAMKREVVFEGQTP